VSDAAKAVPGGFNYIIVCTKALPDRVNTAELVAPAVTDNKTAIVLIQNGVGVEDEVGKQFPHNPCISCVAYIGVTQTKPGVIEHVLLGDIVAGVYNHPNGPAPTCIKDVEALMQRLTAGGIKCTISEDIQAVRWGKVLWNASFGAPSVLTNKRDTHAMLESEDTIQLVRGIMNEIWQTAEKLFGAERFSKISYVSSVEAQISRTRGQPAYIPSLTVDYLNGNPMEVEVIFGNPVRAAKAAGISMPRLETIYLLMRLVAEQQQAKAAKKN
jgi:2-dehydropantoate 2-reductase